MNFLRTGHGTFWTVLLLLIVLVSTFSFLIPASFKAVLDALLPRGQARLFHVFCALILLLVVTRMVLNILQDYLFLRLRQMIERGLLGRYFQSVITLPLSRLQTLGEADLVNRISMILIHFQTLLPELVYYCAYGVCVSLAVMGILYLVNPLFLLLCWASLALHATNFFLHYRVSRRLSDSYTSAWGQLSDVYRDLLRGRKLITLSGLEPPILEGLTRDHRTLYQAAFRRDLAESGLTLGQQLLHGLTSLALVAMGALAMFDGSLSAGELAMCLLLITYAHEPVYRLSRLSKALSEVEAQFARVVPLLSEPSPHPNRASQRPTTGSLFHPAHPVSSSAAGPIAARAESQPGDPEIKCLELHDVTFERAGRALLRNVNCRFVAGHVYVIGGPSGSGKTTLFHLLLGLVSPARGRVLWNGRDVGALSPATLGRWMTYCSQQSLLLDGTVQDNITLFADRPDRARLTEALHQATADGFMDADRAAQVQVENEGANFSGGQRQRLHLARAWYHRAPVMLFDEPTAHLDPDNETVVLQRLASQAEGRIILIISHSPAAAQHASRVLRLADGTLEPLES